MKRVNFYLPVFLLALVLALCLVSPVSADDGSINDPVVITEVQPEASAPAEEAVVESVPMVTRDSGEITVEGDPYFTVGSTTYHFAKDCTGIDNCQESPTPIVDAIDYMETNSLTPSDRKLYIEEDYYEEDVEIDGTANGVKGLTGLVGLGATPDDVKIDGSVTVHDMSAGFSITNMTLENTIDSEAIALYMYDNKGTVTLTDVNAFAPGEDSTGIYIDQTGNVVFNRVEASGNGYQGANIIATGTVSITNSAFDGNLWNTNNGNSNYDTGSAQRAGLTVFANGTSAITLNGVSVSHNGGDGADIYAYNSPVTIKNSFFGTNGSAYDDIGEYWYQVFPGWGDGLYLFGNVVSLSNVDVSNSGMRGMFVEAFGTFTGDRVIAVNNLWSGMEITTCIWFDGDAPYCDNPGAGTVTLKASAASGNGSDGIYIYAKGAVTLYDNYSGWNGNNGVEIINNDAATAVPVTMTLVTAEGNGNSGFYIETIGAVTGTNVRAVSNSNDGLYIEALGTGAVTFKIDTSAPLNFNETCYNGNDGYNITAGGAVSLTSFDSYGNGGNGGTIDNTASPSAPVTLSVVDAKMTMSGLSGNGGYGLEITSNGVVTIKNLDASNNQEYGALIINVPTAGTAKPNVIISNASFRSNCATDVDGNCIDDGGTHNGLNVNSRGLITVSDIKAIGNDGAGAILYNWVDTATAGVTVNASKGKGNSFLSNSENGLTIMSIGPITITNIAANYNGGTGLFAYNLAGTGAVTVKQVGTWSDVYGFWRDGNSFNENRGDGLTIVTKGTVNVAFQEANWNGGTGVYIVAVEGTGAVTVTGRYKQSQNVMGNSGDGIYIIAKGNITLNNVEADYNSGYGAYLHNPAGTGLVTIKYGYFSGNQYGLDVETTGAVNWSYGSADDNFNSGAQLINYTADLAAKPVAVSYVNTRGNGETGLFIISKGAVTLTNVESNNNSANQYYIYDGVSWTDNLTDDQVWYYSGYTGEILSISVDSVNFNPCFSVFSASDGSYVGSVCGTDGSAYAELELPADDEYNIYVWAEDGNNLHQYSITVYDTASYPGSWSYEYSQANGIFIDNSSGSNAAVTVNNKNWTPWNSNNSDTALEIYSSGAVKLTSMSLNDGGGNGLVIGTTGAVTITNLWVYSNAETGVSILNLGAVTIKGSEVSSNGGNGYQINSNGALKMTDVSTYGNRYSGIMASVHGAVVFTNIHASDNSEYGAIVYTPSTFTLNKSTSGANVFNNNSSDGLHVEANGKVTITNAFASNNGRWEYDAGEDEWYPSTSAYGIYVTNTNPSAPQAVVLTDVRGSGNTMNGIQVNSSGAVTISKVVANDNYHDGLSIDQGSSPTSTYAMVLSKVVADNNGWHGIFVYGNGSITLSKFEASFNRGDSGVTLNNQDGLGSVTILNPAGGATNNWALFNAGNGVTVQTNGTVLITGLEVTGNGMDGLLVSNAGSTTSAPITLNTIIARDNSLDGIEVYSNGVVTVNNSWSVNNGDTGINVNTPANVFISNTGAINNFWEGIYADLGLSGNLTLTNCTWYGNLRDTMAGMFSSNLVFYGGSLIIH